MGFRGLIRKLFSSGVNPVIREVESPGDFRYPLDAFERAMRELDRIGPGWWWNVSSGKVSFQIAYRQLNFGYDEGVPLGDVVREAGLVALGDSIHELDDGLFDLPSASAGEMAAVAHAVLTGHYGLEDPYPVRCLLEC